MWCPVDTIVSVDTKRTLKNVKVISKNQFCSRSRDRPKRHGGQTEIEEEREDKDKDEDDDNEEGYQSDSETSDEDDDDSMPFMRNNDLYVGGMITICFIHVCNLIITAIVLFLDFLHCSSISS